MRLDASEQALTEQTGEFMPPNAANECRALVVTGPAATLPAHVPARLSAFLAHLIATKEQVPQTRERRRAEPGEALAAYRTAAALTRPAAI